MRGVDSGRLADVQRLLAAPAVVPNDQNNAGQSALMYACRRGRWEYAKALLQSGAAVNLRQRKGGASAAWILVGRTGNVEMLAALVKEFGADLTIVDDAGRTLLHEAASRGRKRVVEWLVNRPELDASAKDEEGRTALDEAKANPNARPEIAAKLKEATRKRRRKGEEEKGL